MSGGKRSEQAERRRSQLVQVALELFAERGIEAVRISDIAEKADVAQGLLYHYFSGKEALLGAIAERYSPLPVLRDLLADLPDKRARETLTNLTERIYALLLERRQLVRLVVRDVIWRPETRAVALAARDVGLGFVARYLQSRMAAGELRQMDAMTAAQTYASAVFLPGLAGLPYDPYAIAALEVFLRGMAVDPDTI